MRSTFEVKSTGLYPRVRVDSAKVAAVGQAGGVLLTETIRAAGLDRGLSEALLRWRKPLAIHDPGKIVLDLALSLVLGGEALSDVDVLRAEPGVYGPVASDPTVSRLIALLAEDADTAIAAIAGARQRARATVWGFAGKHAPDHEASAKDPVVIDLDASLITAHSLAQLPDPDPRPGRRVLVRADGAGGTKDFTRWLTGRRVSYSVGFTLPMDTPVLYRLVPESVWEPALNSDGDAREGAGLAEFTGLLDLDGWPAGMRVIVRRERPHPGAQLRFDDVDGYRLTAFATNTTTSPLQQLELRHRRRARCEDRIRIAKDTGLANLPLHGFNQNRIWCQIVALASELQAWTGMLALAGHEARRWEPKRLRYRLYSIPATLARRARRFVLHLAKQSRWTDLILNGITRLQNLPAPAT
jgi:hypothetical protein